MNYKGLLFIITLGLLLISSFTLNAQESFEGKITYRVNVELKQDKNPWNKYLSKKWGDSLEIYHSKDGCQKRIYKNSQPSGFEFNIYDVVKNEYYAKWHQSDTIYYYNCSEVVTDFINFEDSEGKEIMSKNCNSVTMNIYHRKSNETIKAKYYYDSSLVMNPMNYANFRDSHLDILYKRIKSHIMEWSIEMDPCKVTFTAIRVEHIDLPIEFFNIPTKMPLKKT